jgi:hypothetical protein
MRPPVRGMWKEGNSASLVSPAYDSFPTPGSGFL